MKIGLVLTTSSDKLASVKHVMASVRDALDGHELIFPHPSITWTEAAEQQRLATEFLRECDAVVGLLQPAILSARQRLERWVPFFFLMLGTMPRGAFGLQKYLPLISSRDCLIVNSDADRLMCERFFENAHVAVLPLTYDEDTFRALGSTKRAEIRRELGLGPEAKVILYPGRITPEKNVHSVLRVFGVLCEIIPDLHLVLAGRILPRAFREFGVTPAAFPRTLARATERLVREPTRVLLAGSVPRHDLNELYNAADVALNLTLHHDENFGLAQVEAMAAGLPVVGTAWGGLKDTIADGRAGYQVSTVATPLGVKVNWWEAVNRAFTILAGAGAPAPEGPIRQAKRFAPERFRQRLSELLRSRLAPAGEQPGGEPIEPTHFAREFWSTCDPARDLRPPYRRGPRSLELYRRMIEPYTGLSPVGVPVEERLAPEHVLCLAVPVLPAEGGGVMPDDPLYPLECELDTGRADVVRGLLRAFAAQPVMSVEHLSSGPAQDPKTHAALEWMIEAGLLLRSRQPAGWISPDRVPASAGAPIFGYQRLPPEGVDFVVAG